MSNRETRSIWLVSLLLAVTTVGVYGQVRGFDFVGIDDARYVTENAQVLSGLTAEGFVWAWTEAYAANWHPLTWLSHMLDVELFDVDPGWHHLTNLGLHVLNALLLLGVLRRLTGALWSSALVAALFALHPLHVESVAWVAERKDVLSCFFWLLTIGVYLGYALRGGARRYTAVALCLAVGLAAKPTLVTLPFVLLLLDYWPLGRMKGAPRVIPRHEGTIDPVSAGRLFVEKLPLILLSVASGVVTYLAQVAAGTISGPGNVPILSRVTNAVGAYATYLRRTFWPSDLSMFYPLGEGWDAGWGAATVLGSLLLLGAVSVLCLRWRKRYPFLVVGWLLYLGTLVPMIGLVQAGRQAMADRYTYISLIGVFIMLGWGAAELAHARPRLRPFLVVLALGALAACLPLTWHRVSAWESSETLARRSLAVVRDNWMGHMMLGLELSARGQKWEAIQHFDEALRLEPELPVAEYNLANALLDLGQSQLAIDHYREALRLHPDYARAAYNLAGVHYELREFEEAAHFYRETIRLWPDFAEAYNYLGNCYLRLDRLPEAREQYEEALHLEPDFTAAREILEQLEARMRAVQESGQ